LRSWKLIFPFFENSLILPRAKKRLLKVFKRGEKKREQYGDTDLGVGREGACTCSIISEQQNPWG